MDHTFGYRRKNRDLNEEFQSQRQPSWMPFKIFQIPNNDNWASYSDSVALPLPKSIKTCLGIFLQAPLKNQGSAAGLLFHLKLNSTLMGYIYIQETGVVDPKGWLRNQYQGW